jgi:hypothetical protein
MEINEMFSKLIDWLFGSDKKEETEKDAWPFPTADNPPKVARKPKAKSPAKKKATKKATKKKTTTTKKTATTKKPKAK